MIGRVFNLFNYAATWISDTLDFYHHRNMSLQEMKTAGPHQKSYFKLEEFNGVIGKSTHTSLYSKNGKYFRALGEKRVVPFDGLINSTSRDIKSSTETTYQYDKDGKLEKRITEIYLGGLRNNYEKSLAEPGKWYRH